MKQAFGRAKLGTCTGERATIKPFEYHDRLTGKYIAVRVTPYYSVLSIDNREYYFTKETGEFDGTSVQVAAGED